jgi:DNA polymerase V
MKAFDAINDKYGRGTIKLGCGLTAKKQETEKKPWQLKRDYLSPCYTTNIKDIPVSY